jgi:hypothetical protein
MATSGNRFVTISDEEIEKMKENAVPVNICIIFVKTKVPHTNTVNIDKSGLTAR